MPRRSLISFLRLADEPSRHHAAKMPTDAPPSNAAHEGGTSLSSDVFSIHEVPTKRSGPVPGELPRPEDTGTIFHVGRDFFAYAPGAQWIGTFPTRAGAQGRLDQFFGRQRKPASVVEANRRTAGGGE